MNFEKLKTLQSKLNEIWINGKPPNDHINWGPHYCFPNSKRPVSVGKIESYFLYNLTKQVKPKISLEIGTGFGYSSWWISGAIGETGKLFSIDNFSEGENIIEKRNFINNSKKFLEITNTTYIEATSPNDLPFILGDQIIDLAFIDGEHYLNAPLNDFQGLNKYLSDSSIVIMHDVQKKYDVNKAIDYAVKIGWNCKLFKTSCGMAILYKELNVSKLDKAFDLSNMLKLL